MTARRGGNETSGSAAHQRLKAAVEDTIGAFSDRMDARDERREEREERRWDSLDARLGRIEHDVASGKLDRATLASDIMEVRRDVGELRDAQHMTASGTTEAAAKGGAAGVTSTVRPVVKSAVREAVSEALTQRWVRWAACLVAGATGFTALVTAAQNLPSAVRAISTAWSLLANWPTS